MKPKGVTTQMKALNEYFLMVVLTLFIKQSSCFTIFMSTLQLLVVKGLKCVVTDFRMTDTLS